MAYEPRQTCLRRPRARAAVMTVAEVCGSERHEPLLNPGKARDVSLLSTREVNGKQKHEVRAEGERRAHAQPPVTLAGQIWCRCRSKGPPTPDTHKRATRNVNHESANHMDGGDLPAGGEAASHTGRILSWYFYTAGQPARRAPEPGAYWLRLSFE